MDQINIGFDQLAELLGQQFTSKYNIQTRNALQIDSKKNRVNVYEIESKQHKAILKLTCKSTSNIQNLFHQANILKALNNSRNQCFNVVKLYNTYDKIKEYKHYLILSLEKCSSNFLEFIFKNPHHNKKNIAFYFIKQIIKAMCDIHLNRVLHMDLKPDNILVKDKIIKIIDFGESLYQTFIRSFTHRITNKYCPPQILKAIFQNPTLQIQYNVSYDIWSFGIILYQTILLLRGTSFQQQMNLIENRTLKQLSIQKYIQMGYQLIFKFSQETNIKEHSKQQLYLSILKYTLVEYQQRKQCSFQNILIMVKEFQNKSRLYFQFLLKRINIIQYNLLQQMFNKSFKFFKLFDKLQKLVLQLCYISIIYQQYMLLIQYNDKQQIIIANIDFNNTFDERQNHQNQYQKQMISLILKSNNELKQFMTLLAPSFNKFKSLANHFKSQYVNIDQLIKQSIDHIQSSTNLQTLFSFQKSNDVMKYLLNHLIQKQINKQDQIILFYLARVCNLEKSFPKQQDIQQKIIEHDSIINNGQQIKNKIKQLLSD